MDIRNQAFVKIMNSPVVYFFSREKIEQAFQNIVMVDSLERFEQLYGHSLNGQKLEGFNRAGRSYIGPSATPHTIIHEVLHTLSSDFDYEGHRIRNSIQNSPKSEYIVEGLTDFLSRQISGEPARHYITANYFFDQLGEVFHSLYMDNQNLYLYAIYFSSNDQFLNAFFAHYCDLELRGKKVVYSSVKEELNFMEKDEINLIFKNIDKNILKKNKNSLFNKLRGIGPLEYQDEIIATSKTSK